MVLSSSALERSVTVPGAATPHGGAALRDVVRSTPAAAPVLFEAAGPNVAVSSSMFRSIGVQQPPSIGVNGVLPEAAVKTLDHLATKSLSELGGSAAAAVGVRGVTLGAVRLARSWDDLSHAERGLRVTGWGCSLGLFLIEHTPLGGYVPSWTKPTLSILRGVAGAGDELYGFAAKPNDFDPVGLIGNVIDVGIHALPIEQQSAARAGWDHTKLTMLWQAGEPPAVATQRLVAAASERVQASQSASTPGS